MKIATFLKCSSLIVAIAGLAAPAAFAQGMMGSGQGMVGGGPGMMGATANERPVALGWGGAVWSYAQVKRYLATSETEGVVDGRTVRFKGSDITIDMVAVQPDHLNLVNMDDGSDMAHGVVVSPAAPRYGADAMMQSGPGLARIAPPIPWRSAEAPGKADYAEAGTTFTARRPGVCWYVCQTPGHLAKGMFGKFLVQGG